MNFTASRPQITIVAVDHERIVVTFVSVELFALVYLQKFALFAERFPLSVPMLLMFAGVGLMLLLGRLTFVTSRAAAYLAFIAGCLLSQSFAQTGSLPSLTELILLYGSMTVAAKLSDAAYRRIMKNFVLMMVIPACIIIEQFAYQTLTGHTDPLSIESLFPQSILLQGFNYAGHFPWYSYFVRPQGLFFLEPSIASLFTASAAIIEITYFRRVQYAALLILATLLSEGATGIIMLVIAAPFLLIRETPRVIALVTIGLIGICSIAFVLDVPLPMMSRVNELDATRSSGGERVTLPAMRLAELAFDPSYWIIGDGAGASSPKNVSIKSAKDLQHYYNGDSQMNAWPMVKVISEYGMLSMLAFVGVFLTGIKGNYNVPLKVALSITYGFTGGYLLNATIVGLLMMLCFIIVPERPVSR